MENSCKGKVYMGPVPASRRDAKKGLASLCIGGGMGVALAIER
jgi:acetyl-CoA acetyltransferase